MDSKKLIFYDRIHAEEFYPLVKTDNYSMVSDDIGAIVILNSSSDKIFTLPNLTSTYNGSRLRCSSIGTGELRVNPYTDGLINNSEYVLCKYQYGVIEFMLRGTNIWIITSTDGRVI